MNETINPDKDILLVEHHWELVVMIHSYNLEGLNGQLKIFAEIYKKVADNPGCKCNQNNIAFLDNIKNQLNHFLKPQEIEKIKKEEEVKIIHIRKTDGSIIEL